MRDAIMILNFSKDYAAQIAVRLRSEGVDCLILPGDSCLEDVMKRKPLGLILAGDVKGEAPRSLDGRLVNSGIPILALGDAALSLAIALNADLEEKERLDEVMTIHWSKSALTEDMSPAERMIQSFRPISLKGELKPLASTDDKVLGFMHEDLPIFGLSFQIERNDPESSTLLMRFAIKVCGASTRWNNATFVSRTKQDIQQALPNGRAICLMTGGLDGGVAALLAKRCLGERVQGLFIDTGFLKEGQASEFIDFYSSKEGLAITRINAAERFYKALDGISVENEKRLAFKKCYQQVLCETLEQLNYDAIITGLTAYDCLFDPDADWMPEELSDKLQFNPLCDLFKGEVQALGEHLLMPHELCRAQAFPNTGLSLRISGQTSPKKVALLRKADSLFADELRRQGLTKRLQSYYATLFPSYDAYGAERYGLSLCAINASCSGERMSSARLPYDLLERIIERLCNAIPEIHKIVYDLSPGQNRQ